MDSSKNLDIVFYEKTKILSFFHRKQSIKRSRRDINIFLICYEIKRKLYLLKGKKNLSEKSMPLRASG